MNDETHVKVTYRLSSGEDLAVIDPDTHWITEFTVDEDEETGRRTVTVIGQAKEHARQASI